MLFYRSAWCHSDSSFAVLCSLSSTPLKQENRTYLNACHIFPVLYHPIQKLLVLMFDDLLITSKFLTLSFTRNRNKASLQAYKNSSFVQYQMNRATEEDLCTTDYSSLYCRGCFGFFLRVPELDPHRSSCFLLIGSLGGSLFWYTMWK